MLMGRMEIREAAPEELPSLTGATEYLAAAAGGAAVAPLT